MNYFQTGIQYQIVDLVRLEILTLSILVDFVIERGRVWLRIYTTRDLKSFLSRLRAIASITIIIVLEAIVSVVTFIYSLLRSFILIGLFCFLMGVFASFALQGVNQLCWPTTRVGLEQQYRGDVMLVVLCGKTCSSRTQCWSKRNRSSGPATGSDLDVISRSKSTFSLPLLYYTRRISPSGRCRATRRRLARILRPISLHLTQYGASLLFSNIKPTLRKQG